MTNLPEGVLPVQLFVPDMFSNGVFVTRSETLSSRQPKQEIGNLHSAWLHEGLHWRHSYSRMGLYSAVDENH